MTDDVVDRAKAALEGVTAGPWRWNPYRVPELLGRAGTPGEYEYDTEVLEELGIMTQEVRGKKEAETSQLGLGISTDTAGPANGGNGAAKSSKQSATPFVACLVTDIGGLNDRGFNHLAYVGLLAAHAKLHATTYVLQSKSPNDYIPNFST